MIDFNKIMANSDAKLIYADVYKVTKFSSNYTAKQVIENEGISAMVCKNTIIIPESITRYDIRYELYQSQVLMIKLDDSLLSDFIVIDKKKNYEIIHSFPTNLNCLFVDIDSIVPYIGKEKINPIKLIKVLAKK